MEQKKREDRITFELMDRIILEENSSDISVIRNVEVTPEIEMVAEYSSYRIRGALVFTGEYEARKQGEGAHPLLLDRTANYNKRVVRQINHRIPVDISVPADRVDDEGIVMEIISLDYDLTDPNHLVVTTELELQGVYKEEVVKNTYWDQATSYEYATRALENEREEEPEEERQVQQEYYFEAQPIQVHQEITPVNEAFEQDKNDSAERVGDTTMSTVVDEDVVARNNAQQPMDVYEPIDRVEPAAPIEDITGANEVEQPRDESQELEIPIEQEEAILPPPVEMRDPEVKVTITQKDRDVPKKATAPSESMKEMNHSNEEEKKESRANTASLLSMFLKNREETMTQIKICLVQPGESLSEIARRYNTNEDDILAINDLSVKSAIGGKVLKIPVRNAR